MHVYVSRRTRVEILEQLGEGVYGEWLRVDLRGEGLKESRRTLAECLRILVLHEVVPLSQASNLDRELFEGVRYPGLVGSVLFPIFLHKHIAITVSIFLFRQ